MAKITMIIQDVPASDAVPGGVLVTCQGFKDWDEMGTTTAAEQLVNEVRERMQLAMETPSPEYLDIVKKREAASSADASGAGTAGA